MFTIAELIAFSAVLRIAAYGEQSYPSGKTLGILLDAYERFSISQEVSEKSAKISSETALRILQNMDYPKRKIVIEWITKMAACDTAGGFRNRLLQDIKTKFSTRSHKQTCFKLPNVKLIKPNKFRNLFINYSSETKSAILKAVLYVISADNKITEVEKKYFADLAMEYESDPSVIDYALNIMSDDEMLRSLNQVNNIFQILIEAARVDGDISDIEIKTILGIFTSIPSVKKEMNKYDTLLKKYGIF